MPWMGKLLFFAAAAARTPLQLAVIGITGSFLLTDKISGNLAEATLRAITKLIVAVGFFAHHKLAAVIAGIEPLRTRHGTRHCAAL